MSTAHLALGSNLGSREQYLLHALNLIHRLPDTRITAVSPVYRSKPLGSGTELPFFNLCCSISTGYGPEQLLAMLKQIEVATGRKPRNRWSEREIDIDIILYDSIVAQYETLQIPHPGLYVRDFVLVPLNQLDTELRDPVSGAFLRKFIPELGQLFIEELLPLQFTILENEILLVNE